MSWLALFSLAAACTFAGDTPIITRTALDKAPRARIESLGVAQTQARLSGYRFSPGTKEYPARALISFWSMADRTFFKTYVVDLSTGWARVASEDGFDKDAPRWPSLTGADGKVFCSCMRGALAVDDPATDEFKMVRPIRKSTWLRGLAIGADGGVYVSDYPTGSAARYDSGTGEVELYGRQGGPFKIKNIYGYSVGSDGEWVYTAVGRIPWYVVACNRKTKEQRILFTLGQEDFPHIVHRGPEVYLSLRDVDQKNNSATVTYYRLANGAATPVEKLPPLPQVSATWTGIPQPTVVPIKRGLPFTEGAAVMRYRPVGKEDEPALGIRLPEMKGEPYRVQRIAPLGDGRLVVATGIYGDVFLFDPPTGAFERVGNPANRNIYCLLVVDGTVYFGGYANAFLGVFDENGKSHFLHDWNQMLGSKRSLSLVLGADGKIYLGNRSEREFVGGSLAWWNPKAKQSEKGEKVAQAGGIRLPNDEANWTIGAMDGKYVVIASQAVIDPVNPDFKPPGGKIIVYSTTEQKIIHEFVPFPDDRPQGARRGSAGMIVEAEPGIILGFTTYQGKPQMYAAQLLSGAMLKKAELPATAQGDLKMGPDGMIYTFLRKTLVRVEPRTLAITPVCKAAPGRMAFIGNNLYLGGEYELRRIKDVTSKTVD